MAMGKLRGGYRAIVEAARLSSSPLSGRKAHATLPATDAIRHFGKGQTETTLTLPPGKHTLQLVLGDHLHIPFNPVVASPKITITVSP